MFSLDEGLRRADLHLPACLADKLRSARGLGFEPTATLPGVDAGNPSNNHETAASFRHLVGSDEMIAYVYAVHSV